MIQIKPNVAINNLNYLSLFLNHLVLLSIILKDSIFQLTFSLSPIQMNFYYKQFLYNYMKKILV